ncbi:hypothetical protein DMC14_002325 [Metamycoplasma phocicerebrale]|uniref:Uncharacterized protein n=1 Tax=Metamycoplasma phocicerebrale TaxID=142649 RepID=A0A3Q9VAD2_9BACT|nr:hypothetical protein [Metamycoplasma phocicerebrale]AZZ65610.1 hypothetical protein DMC14_002325 [Metamycoplasma phocicerebrale]
MSNNKKWKNKKVNINNYQTLEVQKEKRTLSNSWRVALTGLFLIAIPSFLIFLLAGKDGWIISSTKTLNRWSVLLPIALAIAVVQISIVSLLALKFKVLKLSAFIFLVPVAIAMNSFLVSSGVSEWPYRVLPAIGLAFLSIPILLIVKHVEKKKQDKLKTQIEKEERAKKSLLD